jgi:hypothetical protein
MDYEDMIHKMNPMHLGYLRRMLGVNEVPEPVMLRYFSLKKYTDKLSAPISVMDLLRIAMDVGFNLETGKFSSKDPTCEVAKVNIEFVGTEEAVEAAKEEIEEPERPRPEPETVEITPEDVDNEVLDALVSDPNEETVNDFAVQPVRKDGDKVTVYMEGDPKQGIIRGHLPKGATEEVTYKVEIGDEVIEISEEDIEA